MEDNFIKETGLNENELQMIREDFKKKYARQKGWDENNLTEEQLNEIKKQKEWQNPMLLS